MVFFSNQTGFGGEGNGFTGLKASHLINTQTNKQGFRFEVDVHGEEVIRISIWNLKLQGTRLVGAVDGRNSPDKNTLGLQIFIVTLTFGDYGSGGRSKIEVKYEYQYKG